MASIRSNAASQQSVLLLLVGWCVFDVHSQSSTVSVTTTAAPGCQTTPPFACVHDVILDETSLRRNMLYYIRENDTIRWIWNDLEDVPAGIGPITIGSSIDPTDGWVRPNLITLPGATRTVRTFTSSTEPTHFGYLSITFGRDRTLNGGTPYSVSGAATNPPGLYPRRSAPDPVTGKYSFSLVPQQPQSVSFWPSNQPIYDVDQFISGCVTTPGRGCTRTTPTGSQAACQCEIRMNTPSAELPATLLQSIMVESLCDTTTPPGSEPTRFDTACADVTVPANCVDVQPCNFTTQFKAVEATRCSGPQCVELTVCDELTQYQSVAPTPTTDRSCSGISACPPTSPLEIVAPTPTSDRVCDLCVPGVGFLDTPTTCLPVTTCTPGAQYEDQTFTPTTDRVCIDCTSSCVDIIGDIDLAVVVDESISVGAGLADALFSVRQGITRLENASSLNSVAVVRPTQPLGSRVAVPFTTDITRALDVLQTVENNLRATASAPPSRQGFMGRALEELAATMVGNTTSPASPVRPLVILVLWDGEVSPNAAQDLREQTAAATALGQITILYSGATGFQESVQVQLLSIRPPTAQINAASLQAMQLDSSAAPTADVFWGTSEFVFQTPVEVVDVDTIITDGVTDASDTCASYGCPYGQFELSSCTAGANRVCQAYQSCGAGLYEDVAPTPTTDRSCGLISFCAELYYQVAPPTYSTDRECGIWRNCTDRGLECLKPPLAVGQPVRGVSEGCGDDPADEFEVAGPTQTTDRVCQVITLCDLRLDEENGTIAEYEIQVPTWNSDRRCGACEAVCDRRPADVVFLIDASGSIEEEIFGGSPGNFANIQTFTSNVVALFDDPDLALSDTVDLLGPVGSKFASITFSDSAEINFDFNSFGYNESAVQEALRSTPYQGRETYTNRAFEQLIELLERPRGGFRGFRVPLLLFLITDGVSTNPNATQLVVDQFVNQYNISRDQTDRMTFYPIAVQRDGTVVRTEFETLYRDLPVSQQTIYEVFESGISISDLASDAFISAVRADLVSCGPKCPSGQYIAESCGTPIASNPLTCAAISQCTTNQYIRVHPTTTTDRVCDDVTECNFRTQFEATPPVECYAVDPAQVPVPWCTNRVCQNARLCPVATEYETAALTQTTDRQCGILEICGGSRYEAVPPTPTTNRVCLPCAPVCTTGEYQDTPCTSTSNRVCVPYTLACSSTEYQTATPTNTSDRNCTLLTVCSPETQFVTTEATPTSDRTCVDATLCADAEFEEIALTATTDRLCTPRTVCGATQFQISAGNETTDTTCRAFRTCSIDQFTSVLGTPTSDVTCSDLRDCVPGFQFESVAATPTTDRQCQQISTCFGSTEFEVAGPTMTTDRQCDPISTCPDGQFISQNATVSSDTTCELCSRCDVLHEDVVFVVDHRDNADFNNQLSMIRTYAERNARVLAGAAHDGLRIAIVSYEASRTSTSLALTGTLATILDDIEQLQNGRPDVFSSTRPQQGLATALGIAEVMVVGNTSRQASIVVISGDTTQAGSAERQVLLTAIANLNNAIHVTRHVMLFGPGSGHQEGFIFALTNEFAASAPNRGTLFPRAETSIDLVIDLEYVGNLSDTICTPICREGFYRLFACNPLRDRVCEPITTCLATQYETIPFSITTDRVCRSVSFCNISEFQSIPATATTDKVCSPVTVCDRTREFVSAVATPTSDTVCSPITVCNNTVEFERDAPTLTSDRVCELKTVCDLTTEYISQNSTTVSDRNCSEITICSASVEFEVLPPGVFSDRVCEEITQCSFVEFELSAPGPTSDRTCQGCSRCFGTPLDLYFILSASTSLVDPAQGGYDGAFESLRQTIVDIVSSAPASAGLSSSTFTVVTYSTDSVTVVDSADVQNHTALELLQQLPAPTLALGGGDNIQAALADIATIVSGRGSTSIPAVLFTMTDGVFSTPVNAAVFSSAPLNTLTVRRVAAAGRAIDLGRRLDLEVLASDGTVEVDYTTIDLPGRTGVLLEGLCRPCGSAEYESTPCTESTNRVCAPLARVCGQNFYESASPTITSNRMCTPVSNCVNTEFQSTPSTPTSDRVCTLKTVCNNSVQYISTAATATSDATCTPRTLCDSDEFRAAPLDAFMDTQCQTFRITCSQPSEYEASPPLPTADRVCAMVTDCRLPLPDGTLRFQRTAPTATSDRQCANVTTCVAHTAATNAEYTAVPPTATTDRECRSVSTCDLEQQYKSRPSTAFADVQCTNLTNCIAGSEYAFATPTATTDRVCYGHRPPCAADQYEAVSPTLTNDRECMTYTRCTDRQFISTQPTATSDARCTNRTLCTASEYVETAATVTTDSVCATCDRCVFPLEYQVSPCEFGLDAVCAGIRQCVLGIEFETEAPTSTSDRACSTATVCPEDQEVYSQLTATTDRVCGPTPSPCNPETEYEFAPRTPFALAQCRPLTACSSVEYEQLPRSVSSDRTCLACDFTGTCHMLPMDIVVLLDESRSVDSFAFGGVPGQFAAMKDAVGRLVENLNVTAAAASTRVSLATYSDLVTIHIEYNDFTASAALAAAIRSIPYGNGGPANHATALARTRMSLLNANSLASGFRNFTNRVAVVFVTEDQNISAADVSLQSELALLDPRVEIYAITLGSPATSPASVLTRGRVDRIAAATPFSSVDVSTVEKQLCSALCAGGTFLSTACSTSTDNTCADVRVCDADTEFRTAAPTVTTDRTCEALTVCTTTEYETTPATPTSNRACQALTVCNFTQAFERVRATATTDRSCQPLRVCTSIEFESAIPTALTDRGCTPYSTVCASTEFESVGRTASSDRQCVSHTAPCATFERESVSPSPTTDRVCVVDVPAGWTARTGFCATHTAVPPVVVGNTTMFTLRECASLCNATDGCDAFTRERDAPYSPCYLGSPINHCCSTLVPEEAWSVWTSLDRCGGSCVGSPAAFFEFDRPFDAATPIVSAPNFVWESEVDRVCANALTVVAPDILPFDQCQTLCESDATCEAFTFGDGVGCILASSCRVLRIPSFSVHFKPTGGSGCERAVCDTVTTPCFEASTCVNATGMCVSTPNSGGSCTQPAFSSAVCNRGNCEPVCPVGNFISAVPFQVQNATTITQAMMCSTISQCCPNEFELSAPTSEQDRMCAVTTVCTTMEYETTAPTTTTDRECALVTICTGDEYIEIPHTSTSDAVCTPHTQCDLDTQFITVPATATSDRSCATVGACGLFAYESSAPTNTSDRVCTPLTTCDSSNNEYTAVNATSTSDRICAVYTSCAPLTFESTSPTAFADRQCSNCTKTCSNAFQPLDITFIVDESGSVEYPWHGGAFGNFDLQLAFFQGLATDLLTAPSGSTRIAPSRVAAVSYSSTASVDFTFNRYAATGSIVGAIGALEYEGLGTNVSAALRVTRQQLFEAAGTSGYRGGGELIPSVVVLLVNGDIPETPDLTREVSVWSTLSVSMHIIHVNPLGESLPVSLVRLSTEDRITSLSSFQVLPVGAAGVAGTDSFCIAGCPLDQYQRTTCSASTDATCAPLSASCSSTEFESFAATTTSDRTCTAITTCTASEYLRTPATPTTDNDCRSITPACTDGQFVLAAATATSDLVCQDQTALCSELQVAPPTATSARLCQPWTVCGTNAYETQRPTRDTDRTCAPLTTCSQGTFETRAPTASTDRHCGQCTVVCTATEFASGCVGTQDRVCTAISECRTGLEFETRAPTPTSDRVCRALATPCVSSMEIETVAPTATSDRQCTTIDLCGVNEYQLAPATVTSQTVCASVRTCGVGQFESAAPTPTSDRRCTDSTGCDIVHAFEVTARTATTDRVCSNLTACVMSALQYVATAATYTTDRVCGTLPTCDLANNYYDSFIEQDGRCLSASPTCRPLTQCTPLVQYEVQPPTRESDRECAPLTVCQELLEQQLVAPTATSDRVCGPVVEPLARFTSGVALSAIASERLQAQGGTPTADACASFCVDSVTGCVSFAHSVQYEYCITFGTEQPNPPGAQQFDLMYYRLLDDADSTSTMVPTTTPAATTTEFVSPYQSFFRDALDGSTARGNLHLPESFQVLHDCYTLPVCQAACLDMPHAQCKAVDFSANLSTCILVTAYLPRQAVPGAGFQHHARHGIASVETVDLIRYGTYFGDATRVQRSGVPDPLVVLGGSGNATYGQINTVPTSYGHVVVEATFRQAPQVGLSYLVAKSSADGSVVYFAVGVTEEGQVVVTYRPHGSTTTARLVLSTRGIAVGDGFTHALSVGFYGQWLDVTLDGTVLTSAAIAAPMSDGDGVLLVGQQAPGVGSFRGAIMACLVRGVQLNRQVVPPAVALLSPAVTVVSAGRDGDGVVVASDVIPPISAVTNTFSVAMDVVQVAGSNGYLFAKTNNAGTRRYVSLYVPRTGNVRLYYRTHVSDRQRVAYFNAVINDGMRHELIFSASGRWAQLRVDDSLQYAALAGAIDDCATSAPSDCVMHLGQRAGGGASREGVHAMSGTIYETIVHPSAAFATFPFSERTNPRDLLHEMAVDALVGDAAPLPDGGGIHFGGNGRYIVAAAVADVFATSEIRLAVRFAQLSQPAGGGYLLSHSDAGGNDRYVAVYSSVSRFITLFYRIGGVQRSTRIVHGVDTEGTGFHDLRLYIAGDMITVVFDSHTSTHFVSGASSIDICPATSCVTAIGQKLPQDLGFNGTIESVIVEPSL
eukprot:m.25151 g.25151  ORF g.25151 m.25151 type:complete len:4654 (-) comp13142_c0_seq1:95-14056(-)